MTQQLVPGIKPQVAQRPDGRWVASAIAYWFEHGAEVSCPLSWAHAKDFETPAEAATFAHEQGNAWLKQKLSGD